MRRAPSVIERSRHMASRGTMRQGRRRRLALLASAGLAAVAGIGALIPAGTAAASDACTYPTIVGTPYADSVSGTVFNDVVDLMEGNDSFYDNGGNDTVC